MKYSLGMAEGKFRIEVNLSTPKFCGISLRVEGCLSGLTSVTYFRQLPGFAGAQVFVKYLHSFCCFFSNYRIVWRSPQRCSADFV